MEADIGAEGIEGFAKSFGTRAELEVERTCRLAEVAGGVATLSVGAEGETDGTVAAAEEAEKGMACVNAAVMNVRELHN